MSWMTYILTKTGAEMFSNKPHGFLFSAVSQLLDKEHAETGSERSSGCFTADPIAFEANLLLYIVTAYHGCAHPSLLLGALLFNSLIIWNIRLD